MRLDDAITYFLGQWPAEGAPVATVRTYGQQLKSLAEFAAKRHKLMLSDLTPDLLRAAMAAKMAQQTTPSSFKGGEAAANSLAYAARKMARWLLDQGVPVANLDIVKPRKPPERVQPRLTGAEFLELEDAILHRLVDGGSRVPRATIARDLALIYMLADTGLRASEVCAMDVRSVDFDRGAVLVLRGSGKGRKERALSIVNEDDPQHSTTLRLLADWIRARSTISRSVRHQKLWVSAKGNPLSTDELRGVLNRLCATVGIDNRPPHTFRRANFTESYLAQPTAIRVLASRMGWSPKSHHMIDVYTRGVDIDFARTTPVPSVSSRWSQATSPKVTLLNSGRSSVYKNGVGPPTAEKANGPPLPSRGRVDKERTASQTARGGRRYQ